MISVIIATYNRGEKIEDAIESVLNQTYTNWELIIVDDGSNDDTKSRVHKYLNTKIRYIKLNRNRGVSYARNIGIAAAKGKYIAFLDSDDVWYSMHLKECVEVLEFTGYKVCSALWEIDVFGEIIKIGETGKYNDMYNAMKGSLGIERNQRYWKFPDKLFTHIILNDFYCFHINTIVIEKTVVDAVGGFDESLRMSEDLDFMYRVLMKYKLVTVNNFHFLYRYGNDNIYAFCNRELRGFKKELLCDSKIRRRIVMNLRMKIYFHKKTRRLVLGYDSDSISKKMMLDKIDRLIYCRMMSCCVLCRKEKPWLYLYMFIASMKYWRKYRDVKREGIFFVNTKYWETNLTLD